MHRSFDYALPVVALAQDDRTLGVRALFNTKDTKDTKEL
jgi:hypothetical protein